MTAGRDYDRFTSGTWTPQKTLKLQESSHVHDAKIYRQLSDPGDRDNVHMQTDSLCTSFESGKQFELSSTPIRTRQRPFVAEALSQMLLSLCGELKTGILDGTSNDYGYNSMELPPMQ